jgi:hypothetical protein
MSALLLLYTAIAAPVQVFVWEVNEEECNIFPTLYFDIIVDVFFMVRFPGLLSLGATCAMHSCLFLLSCNIAENSRFLTLWPYPD